MTKQYTTDVVIIGAGPVGLFAIFECGMVGLKCHVIDSLEEIGGQCTALYPEKPIYDIPGLPKVQAGDLIANLEEQAKSQMEEGLVQLSFEESTSPCTTFLN